MINIRSLKFYCILLSLAVIFNFGGEGLSLISGDTIKLGANPAYAIWHLTASQGLGLLYLEIAIIGLASFLLIIYKILKANQSPQALSTQNRTKKVTKDKDKG